MNFKIFSSNHHTLLNRINNFYTTSKNLYGSYYDILKLERNCSTTDIKNAFIKLSKQYHPDTATDTASHKDFVKLVEAYNTLSKPHLRRNYDLGLINPIENMRSTNDVYYEQFSEKLKRDSQFWEYRDKSEDQYYESKPYYGIKGIQRVSNGYIVMLCILVAAIGVCLQVVTIRKSVTFKRDQMIKRSREAEDVLSGIREDALKNGNKVQIQRLKERMEERDIVQKEDVNQEDEEAHSRIRTDAIKHGNRLQLQRLKERMEERDLIQKDNV